MPGNKSLGFILIILFTVGGILLTRMGISYLIVLILIGLLVSFISKSKLYAVITGVMYAIVSYILTYPAGLFLIDYMPTSDVVIETSSTTVITDLIMGALIPSIFAIIVCGICALIGASIANYIRKDDDSNQEENKSKGHHFNVMDNFEKSNKNKNNRKKGRKGKKGKFMNPIEKAKLKKQNEEE